MGTKPTLPEEGDCLAWVWETAEHGDEDTYPYDPPDYFVRCIPEVAASQMAEQWAESNPDEESVDICTLDPAGVLVWWKVSIERVIKTRVDHMCELDPEDP